MTIFVLALIAAAVAIVVFAPVRVELEWDRTPGTVRPHVWLRARWLFFVWRSGKPRRERPERAAPPHVRRRAAGPSRSRRVLAALRTPGFVRRIGRLAVELLRSLAPRAVEGWVRIGFDDPMFTGVLFGAAQAATGLARAIGWRVRLEPEFAGPMFAGHARIEWAVRPGALLWPVGTFMASPAAWRGAVAALRGR
jgi:hypothetical protein